MGQQASHRMTHFFIAAITFAATTPLTAHAGLTDGWLAERNVAGRITVVKWSESTLDVIEGRSFSIRAALYCSFEVLPAQKTYSTLPVPQLELTVTAPFGTLPFADAVKRLGPLDAYVPVNSGIDVNGQARTFHFTKLPKGYFSAYSIVSGTDAVRGWLKELRQSPRVVFNVTGKARTFDFTGIEAAAAHSFQTGGCHWK
jgi:hypothetical protein